MRGLKKETKMNTSTKSRLIKVFLWTATLLFIISILVAQNNLLVPYENVFQLNDLPKSLVGYKICHISDINNSNVNIVKAVKKFEPDIILMSGGYSDSSGNASNTISEVEALCEIAPVYYVLNYEDMQKDPNVLNDTGAINLTDSVIEVNKTYEDTKTFIKTNYDGDIWKKYEDGDEEVVKYITYVEDELERTKNDTLRITGMHLYNSEENGDEAGSLAVKYMNKITSQGKRAYDIALVGNIDLVEPLCESNVDIIFTGGTYGTDKFNDYFKKGHYGFRGKQVFVSGGVGGHEGVRRIFNFPEIQLITLSDGSIKQRNPLEKFIDKLTKNTSDIMSNDSGYHSGTLKTNRELDEKLKENEEAENDNVNTEITTSN